MTIQEKIQKAIEERFWGQGYYIIDKPEYYHVQVIADDGIFGKQFIQYIVSLKIPFHIDCSENSIEITRIDAEKETK